MQVVFEQVERRLETVPDEILKTPLGILELLRRYPDLWQWATDTTPWGGRLPPMALTVATLLCYDMVGGEQKFHPGEFDQLRGEVNKAVVLKIANHYSRALNAAAFWSSKEGGRFTSIYERLLDGSWNSQGFDRLIYIEQPLSDGSVSREMFQLVGQARITRRPRGLFSRRDVQEEVLKTVRLPPHPPVPEYPSADPLMEAREKLRDEIQRFEQKVMRMLRSTLPPFVGYAPQREYRDKLQLLLKEARGLEWSDASRRRLEPNFDFWGAMGDVYFTGVVQSLGNPPLLPNGHIPEGFPKDELQHYVEFSEDLRKFKEAQQQYRNAKFKNLVDVSNYENDAMKARDEHRITAIRAADKFVDSWVRKNYIVDGWVDDVLVTTTHTTKPYLPDAAAFDLPNVQHPSEKRIVQIYCNYFNLDYDTVHDLMGCKGEKATKVLVKKKEEEDESSSSSEDESDISVVVEEEVVPPPPSPTPSSSSSEKSYRSASTPSIRSESPPPSPIPSSGSEKSYGSESTSSVESEKEMVVPEPPLVVPPPPPPVLWHLYYVEGGGAKRLTLSLDDLVEAARGPRKNQWVGVREVGAEDQDKFLDACNREIDDYGKQYPGGKEDIVRKLRGDELAVQTGVDIWGVYNRIQKND